MGIFTADTHDRWVNDQWQGFDGFPPDQLGVLALASPAGQPQLMNINPAAGVVSVFGVNIPNDGQGGVTTDMDPNSLSINGSAGGGGTAGQGGMIGPAVLPSLQPMPSMTTASMPTMTGTSNAAQGTNGNVGTTPAAITPEYLNQRLPSIVNSAPSVIPTDCGGGFAGWVSDNPGIAAAGLAALAFCFWGKK